MKSILLFSVYLLIFSLISCIEPDEPEVEFDTPVELGAGKSLTLPDGVKITFISTRNDSRCPKNIKCFWEGEAEIGLSLQKPGLEKSCFNLKISGYILKDNTGSHKKIELLGYEIKLMQLDPYPEYPNLIKPENYKALINISRIK